MKLNQLLAQLMSYFQLKRVLEMTVKQPLILPLLHLIPKAVILPGDNKLGNGYFIIHNINRAE